MSRFRSWFKRRSKRLGIEVAVALVLYLAVRATVVEAFVAPTDSVAPEVPQNARVLVLKCTSTFRPGDIVVYRDQKVAMIGRVDSVSAKDLSIGRRNEQPQTIARDRVVGRVILNTR